MGAPARTAKDVFDHALEITSSAERKAYLDQACGDAPELRQKVEALLQAYEDAGSSFLKKPAYPLGDTGPYQPGEDTPDQSSDAQPPTVDDLPRTIPEVRNDGSGTRIGPYQLIEILGQGGMGIVWRAEQTEPIRRQVALKIIKPGMDSAHVIARFEAERQALTMMDHVNIARVLDAGTTERGLPYFVMELVKGIPMSRFCNENTLTPRERLMLFATVCEAVQHAHQKGVIHRDLKPGNVLVALVEGKPTPKIIDFGLAKATEQPLTDHSEMTRVGMVLGTIAYMSPEQAFLTNLGIDTRTDIYSLGVMLYELLTGTTPLDASQPPHKDRYEALAKIKDVEPPKPSAWVSSLREKLPRIAAQRKTEPARLVKLLRGELDWITLKALEKDRERRYETASGFGKDVQRYLDDEPVEACPPSAGYRLGKFARKHRTLLAVVGGFIALLTLGIAGLTWGIVIAKKAQNQAEKAEKKTRAAFALTWGGIRSQIHQGIKPAAAEVAVLSNMLKGYEMLVAEIEPDASRQQRATAAETAVRVANLSALIGSSDKAEGGYRKAIELYEALANDFKNDPEYPTELAKCHFDLAFLLSKQNQPSDAEAEYRRSIDLFKKVVADFPDEPAYRSELADAYNNLGTLLLDREEFAQAEQAIREAILLHEKVVADEPDRKEYVIHLAGSYNNLANTVRRQGDAKASLVWYKKASDRLYPMNPRPALAILYYRNNCWDKANAFGQLGRLGEPGRVGLPSRHLQASGEWRNAIRLDLDCDGKEAGHLQCFLAASLMEEQLEKQSKEQANHNLNAYLTLFLQNQPLAAATCSSYFLTVPKPESGLLYEAAGRFAQAATAAKEADDPDLQKQYVKRSLELLQLAKAADWSRDPQHIKQLKDDKRFDSLPAANFTSFLESLEARNGAKDRSEKK